MLQTFRSHGTLLKRVTRPVFRASCTSVTYQYISQRAVPAGAERLAGLVDGTRTFAMEPLSSNIRGNCSAAASAYAQAAQEEQTLIVTSRHDHSGELPTTYQQFIHKSR